MKRKLIFLVVATLLLAPWPVAYAYGDANEMRGQTTVQVEAAPAGAGPQWQAFGKAIGGVTPGDLFYIETTESQADVALTLYITNADELVHLYRYLTLKVGVYVQNSEGQWELATAGGKWLLPDTWITLIDGSVSLTLPGCARYKITIDKGCFYCYGVGAGGKDVSPAFYLTADN